MQRNSHISSKFQFMCNEIYSTRSTTTQQLGELNYGTHFNGIIKYAVLIENTAKSIEIYPPGTQKCLSWLTLSVVCLSLDRSPIAAKYNVIELCKPSIRSFQDFSHSSSSSSSLRFPYFSSSTLPLSPVTPARPCRSMRNVPVVPFPPPPTPSLYI